MRDSNLPPSDRFGALIPQMLTFLVGRNFHWSFTKIHWVTSRWPEDMCLPLGLDLTTPSDITTSTPLIFGAGSSIYHFLFTSTRMMFKDLLFFFFLCWNHMVQMTSFLLIVPMRLTELWKVWTGIIPQKSWCHMLMFLLPWFYQENKACPRNLRKLLLMVRLPEMCLIKLLLAAKEPETASS